MYPSPIIARKGSYTLLSVAARGKQSVNVDATPVGTGDRSIVLVMSSPERLDGLAGVNLDLDL